MRNIGPDPALHVHVRDELPTDLAIPAGMAPARGILAPLVLAIAYPWRTLLITVLTVLALLATRRRSRRARFAS